MTAEVDRGGSVVDLVRQDGQFVVDPLSNREPMQLHYYHKTHSLGYTSTFNSED